MLILCTENNMVDDQIKKFNLKLWSYLFSVIENGSISRTARQLGLDRSQLSRAIAFLESETGCSLLERKGRYVLPTQSALTALKTIQPLIGRMVKAVDELSINKESDSGNIRFGAMPGFLQTQVIPLIAEFQQMYPSISFDVIGEDNPKAILNGQSDLMLYYGPVHDINLIEHWVTRSAFIPCAAPSYLLRAGTPNTPEELASHAGVIYTGNVRPHSTVLTKHAEERNFSWKTMIRFNNILLAKSATLEGCGIVVDMPLHHCVNEILEGKLVPVLNGWHIPNLENYIGSTSEAGKLKRVQLFIEWYIEKRRSIEGAQKRAVQAKFPFLMFD